MVEAGIEPTSYDFNADHEILPKTIKPHVESGPNKTIEILASLSLITLNCR